MNGAHRQFVVNRYPSVDGEQVLSQEQYHRRGQTAVTANIDAIDSDPRNETSYPDWSIRYANLGGSNEVRNAGSLYDGFMAEILADPALNIDDTSNWSAYNFYTKSVASRLGNLAYDSVGTNIPRLYNSELMYQSWRDACNAYSRSGAGDQMKNLKFIIRGPIVNEGTHNTIEDLLETDFSDHQLYLGAKATYSATGTTTSFFKILMGTDNGIPVARMCTDHAESLGGKRVDKIHVWNYIPGSFGTDVLVFELA
ncbi:hypothetical protein EAF04_006123 [Stromatinia cepivora]|nr:hypothetical protein EAF04_006123 [Stromatinia cepivora]